MDKTEEDDGSLAFLKIPEQDGNKQFHGKDISQSELVNTSFWVLDITLTNTKFGNDRMLGMDGASMPMQLIYTI